MSVKEYVAKIQNTYALLEASGFVVLEAEKVEIILVGLSLDYDTILMLASFSNESLPLKSFLISGEIRDERCAWWPVIFYGRGRGFRTCLQCQICGRYGHLAQKCYYRFDRDYGSPSAPASNPPLVFSGSADRGSRENGLSEHGWSLSGRSGLVPFGGSGPYVSASMAASIVYPCDASWGVVKWFPHVYSTC
ncbi:hypothetical protein J1N35_012067 [Gossypium stocksii]|uniref:CCHC-type domain-containing protein n=1 Tax=Gossypium stocksii TaxID=47602 RepID=A0A9D4ADX0_9ROSI|nr:hypothetical protein J1N35_012067 [Gossypium stocksii]